MRETKLPEKLILVDVETPLDGRVYEERAMTRFVPQGYATPTWIHLEDDSDREYTVIVNASPGLTPRSETTPSIGERMSA